MSAAVDPSTGVTTQQDTFCQWVASGLSLSDAYRASYNVGPDTAPQTIWVDSCQLAAKPNVALRLALLRDLARQANASQRGWDRDRVVGEAETNLLGARTSRQWASANGALELISRVTGLLTDTAPSAAPIITRVTVMVQRNDAEGMPKVTETTYQVLPDAQTPAEASLEGGSEA